MDSPQEMPGFLPASTIPRRNLTREEELEEEVRRSKAETMRVLELLGSEQSQSRKPATTGPKPQEWQALQTVISDLLEANKNLQATVKKQALQIEDLQKANDRIEQNVIDVKGLAKTRIGELLAEIVDIRAARKLDNERVNDHAEAIEEFDIKINEHAEAINKVWQAAKKQSIPKGKKSIARIEQLTEILKGGPRTYGELGRLLKVSPKEMNRLVSMLDTRRYEIFFRAGDNRQKVLRLRSWNGANQQSKSLTSNVKYLLGEDRKEV